MAPIGVNGARSSGFIPKEKPAMNPLAFAAALTLLAAPALAQDQSSSLRLSFETGASTGAVLVAVYDSEAAYSNGEPVRRARVEPGAGPAVAEFDGLEAGDYAVKAFHDLNGDGRMNVNPFGIPLEPFAFSNNAAGDRGPASWARARFAVSGATAQTISIR